MGLAERRAAKDFETNVFPQLKQQIVAAAGFDVPIDVKWDSISPDSKEKDVASWKDAWPKLYFLPVVEALKVITADDMGKEALKAALKAIVVQSTKKSYSSDGASFDKASGTLTIDYTLSNVHDVKSRTDACRKILEKNL